MNNFNLLEPLRDQAAPYSLFKKIGTHFPLKLGLVCLSCILIGRMNSLPTARLGSAAAAPGDLVKAAARKSRADQGSLEMQSCVVSGIQKCWNEVKNENGFCLNTRGRGKPWGATRQTAGLWEAHASVFSAVSPQGDGARGCRDAKSRAGLQGAA